MEWLSPQEESSLTNVGFHFAQLVGLFTADTSTVFHAICSIITKGIGGTPSKARKRQSFLEFFHVLYKNSRTLAKREISPRKSPSDLINPEKIQLSFFDIYSGNKSRYILLI